MRDGRYVFLLSVERYVLEHYLCNLKTLMSMCHVPVYSTLTA